MRFQVLIIRLFIILLYSVSGLAVKKVVTNDILVVAGESTSLPCRPDTSRDNDSLALVLWYREDLGTPIYSVDMREDEMTGTASISRWSSPRALSSRAHWSHDSMCLLLKRSQRNDTGIYRCRLDYRHSQTFNARVNLTVIEPPRRLVVTDDKDSIKKVMVGPYTINDVMVLYCTAYGGFPQPWIRWYVNNSELNATSTSIQEDNSTRSELRVTRLTRDYLSRAVSCRAGTHALVQHIETTLTIDMNLPPIDVEMSPSCHTVMSAGRKYTLWCRVYGSRPPPTIRWWVNEERIPEFNQTVSKDGNSSLSILLYTARKEHSDANIICRAHNPIIEVYQTIEGYSKLNIHYTPIATVKLGANLDPDNIHVGSDVYYDCIVEAVPEPNRIEWTHNGAVLNHNISNGIIISNMSLVLQSVTRHMAGTYTCSARNTEGIGRSDVMMLSVLYSPTCKTSKTKVLTIPYNEHLNISCDVDSSPKAFKYRWILNNTVRVRDVSSKESITYKPKSELDYGTLSCWAINKIGLQKAPCLYEIMQPNITDIRNDSSTRGCHVTETTTSSFRLECVDHLNTTDIYGVQVRNTLSQEVIMNVSSSKPAWNITKLLNHINYNVTVYKHINSTNLPVSSLIVSLHPNDDDIVAREQTSIELRFPLNSQGIVSIAMWCGIALTVLTLALLTIISVYCHYKRKESSQDDVTDKTDGKFQENSNNPDIISGSGDETQFVQLRHSPAYEKKPARVNWPAAVNIETMSYNVAPPQLTPSKIRLCQPYIHSMVIAPPEPFASRCVSTLPRNMKHTNITQCPRRPCSEVYDISHNNMMYGSAVNLGNYERKHLDAT